MEGLRLEKLVKSFGETLAVNSVSFEVGQGEILAVLGPSGCGKSTILNLIAGLDNPDSGGIFWNEQSLEGVHPHQRGFGLMFQDYALFPHRNVEENVSFGLKMMGMGTEQMKQRTEEVLQLVGLPGYARRDVNNLSGGEQQRVALARSLAPQPKLLMLDEPLGSLDRTLRERLVEDLRRVLRHEKLTAIYVTHDQEEAFVLSDRIVVLNAGKIEQTGTAQEIYQTPASIFVARFLGLNNLISGAIFIDGTVTHLRTNFGVFPIDGDYKTGDVKALLRPDAVRLDGRGRCQLTALVSNSSFRGNSWRLSVTAQGERLQFEIPAFSSIEPQAPDQTTSGTIPKIGEKVCLSFDPGAALQIFTTRGQSE